MLSSDPRCARDEANLPPPPGGRFLVGGFRRRNFGRVGV